MQDRNESRAAISEDFASLAPEEIAARRAPSPLSLTQPAPPGWQHDRPAFPNDPFMDWESETERPPKGPFEASDQSRPR